MLKFIIFYKEYTQTTAHTQLCRVIVCYKEIKEIIW
nr:MAG TPA: hypothetical protein [Caudoviricetes sp.]